MWPLPRSTVLGNDVTTFDPNTINVVFDPPVDNVDINMMLKMLVFKRRDALTSAGGNVERDVKATGLEIRVALADVNYEMIKKDTKESYTLSVSTNVVTIDADNFFGARHAVETLFQVAEKPGTLTEREGSVQLTSLY